VDPWQVLNPSEIWLLAILIAAISFAGYVAVRVWGDRKGIAVAAVAGGLSSSTATTLSYARLAREHPASTSLLAGGILLAGVTMLARVVVLVGLVKPELLGGLLLPAASAAGVLLAGAAALVRARRDTPGERPQLEIRNPFDLGTVLQLAALIAVILVVAKTAAGRLGAAGIYLLAAVSGIADVDALTLSMARFAGAQLHPSDAVTAILVAAGVNTAAKAAMAAGIGGRRLGAIVGAVSGAALVALAGAAATVR
jgi:uncharacterized membrane protein (DUF4010 family)